MLHLTLGICEVKNCPKLRNLEIYVRDEIVFADLVAGRPMSSSTSRGGRGRGGRRAPKPKWINPCGINSQTLQRLTQNFGGHYDVTPLTDGELLENVVLAAKNALKHSRFFKEDYVSTDAHLFQIFLVCLQ